MPFLRDKIPTLLGIILGSLLYVILNFIPFLGPFLAGVTAGKISRGDLKNGLLSGFISGILGSLLIFFLFSRWLYSWNIFGKFLVGSLLLLWNLAGIILTTTGGLVGAILLSKERLSFPGRESKEEPERKIFVVCKNCKAANSKGEEYCRACGEKL